MTQQKTDGHVQYVGGWRFFLSLQPGLTCEFTDHHTCKEKSAEHDARIEALDDAAKAEYRAEQMKNVDAAAAQAVTDAQTARIAKAGQRKHEATRQNGLMKNAALARVERQCADRISSAQIAYEHANREARQALLSESDAITAASIELQNEINATDYLAQVVQEESDALTAQREQDAHDLEVLNAEKDKADKDALAAKTLETANAALADLTPAPESTNEDPTPAPTDATEGEPTAQP
jgi:hypothetical protein